MNVIALCVGTTPVTLVKGDAKKVLNYCDSIANKQALVVVAPNRDASQLAVFHIGGDFEGNLIDAKQQILDDVVQAFTKGLGPDFTGYHAFHSLDGQIRRAIGGALIGKIPALGRLTTKIGDMLFDKQGFIRGSRGDTEIMLIGPDGSRSDLAWTAGKTNTVKIPNAFEDTKIRNTFVGTELALIVDTENGIFMATTAEQIKDLVDGQIDRYQFTFDTVLQIDGQIDDVTVGSKIADGKFQIVATGTWGGKYGMQNVLAEKQDGGWMFQKLGEPLFFGQDEKFLQGFGAMVRWNGLEADFVKRDEYGTSLTRVQTTELPLSVFNYIGQPRQQFAL